MLQSFAWDERFRIAETENVLTPALVVYPEFIASNISQTLKLLAGDGDRWRVHVKTAKLGHTLKMLLEQGVHNFKCATTLELLVACRNGAKDVLFAYPAVGANAKRVKEIANEFPGTRISVLAESEEQVRQWGGSSVAIFVDINPGMNRTGIEQDKGAEIARLVAAIRNADLRLRGLHYYDGHYGGLEEPARTIAAHEGYERLLQIVAEIEAVGASVEEIITAGTPTFPCSLSFAGFRDKKFVHRISPGTVVYNDATSLAQLSPEYGFKPAVLVLSRVVSRPRADMICCDGGHKAVSADAGVPTCVVVGHAELAPLSPSEEHLPMTIASSSSAPQVGEAIYLLPRHVCPTVNNFDCAVLVENGKVAGIEKVSARGREAPLLRELAKSNAI
ncbi:MAG: alanine racemase [Acidobacteria bacterium]|nr:alanine racemase [Acidobacteriota bacterium]MBS1867503.1 alanine racemase [Acidobacteriota bacterium]